MENTTSDNGNHGIPIVKTEEIGYSYDSEDTGPINDHRQQINHTLDIPEARGLVWDDCFYDSMEGVIAVFDVNRDDFVSATFRANMTRLVSALFRGIGLGGIVFVKMIVAPLWLALLVALPVTLFYVIYFWSGFSRDFKEMEGFYHIAVFKNAIRLDCEGFPSSTTLIPFQDIRHVPSLNCSVKDYAIIVYPSGEFLRLRGIRDPRSFISLVNALLRFLRSNDDDSFATVDIPREPSYRVYSDVETKSSEEDLLFSQVTNGGGGVIAVFDVEVQKLMNATIRNHWIDSMATCGLLVTILNVTFFSIMMCGIILTSSEAQRARLAAAMTLGRSIQVVVWNDGIRVNHMIFPSGPMSRTTTHINFKEIKSIDLRRSFIGGFPCCCFLPEDYEVEITSNSILQKKFIIPALRNPNEFVDMVHQMMDK